MIKKLYFMPLLAALALTACSDKDVAEVDEPGYVPEADGKDIGYVAVNILQPNDAGTRAASAGFEYGSDDENYAAQGLFFIFDDNASDPAIVGSAQRINLTKGAAQGNTPEVEAIYNAVLVIDGKAETDPTVTDSKQIVCVLNAPAFLEDGTKFEDGITHLSDLEKRVADYSAHTRGNFLMTNSVYKENNEGKKILGAVINSTDIKTSASAALAAPVNVYVERIVAKIVATGSNDFDNNGATITVDGEEIALNINITGIEIANMADDAYLFKNITGISHIWAWDAANKRSYWETLPTPLTYSNKSYNMIQTPGFDIKSADYTEYLLPNTTTEAIKKTSVLVTAQLTSTVTNEKIGAVKDQPFKFVYLRGGYFAPNSALALIATHVANQGYWKKVTEQDAEGKDVIKYTQLPATDFEWVNNYDLTEKITWLKDYEVVARVKSTVENMFKKVGDDYIPVSTDDIAALNNDLKGTETSHPYVARVFDNGLCYYFVEIDHSPIAKATAGTYHGVVRNHVYRLALSSIGGIGTPVFDPTDVIIPQRPSGEDLCYLSASIQVLAWRIVEQKVDFGGTDMPDPNPAN